MRAIARSGGLARLVYSILFYLILPLVVLRHLWRSLREPLYRERMSERFGFCAPVEGRPIWVHAVSAGETIAAVPFIRQLAEHYPVVVTNMTATGRERARTLLGDSVVHAYAPYDLPDGVARFLSRVNPQVAVFIDTEVWPNMIALAVGRGIPVELVNARMSAKSASGYARGAALSRPMFGAVSGVCAQTDAHRARFLTLGVPQDRVVVTGSIKFDMVVDEAAAAALTGTLPEGGPVFMAGSTHAGEEEDAVLQAVVVARQKIPGLRMILVPRHPWRFDGAADACRALGLSVVRRSSGEAASASTDVFLVDTMGELRAFYSLCDVAFVGGSLAPEGGHNLLEAAAFRVPVIMGPHLYDIDDIAEPFREAGALKVVAGADELAAQLTKWSLDVEAGAAAGERAKGLFDANQGATRRSVERVLAHARRFDSAG
tara:strand:+ start:4676 stop:5968 length:1293 start_codon:yes stop_codon:yes gene_type:complete